MFKDCMIDKTMLRIEMLTCSSNNIIEDTKMLDNKMLINKMFAILNAIGKMLEYKMPHNENLLKQNAYQ